MKKILAFFVAIWTFIVPFARNPEVKINQENWKTNYNYVWVHGLSGWGSYDSQYKLMPYWGMFGGDLLKYLNKQGYNCYAASVAPEGSAWDRACELYAQLTGTVTDYGEAHSERCNHERFGKDFTGKALVPSFSAEDKINILGHSFGGATVRLFTSLMAKGDEAEMAKTSEDDISPFFTGGKADWIYSVTTLAAPHNGTTAYNIDKNDPDAKTNPIEDMLSNLVSAGTKPKEDSRIPEDYASYDMYIDNALELNDNLALPENIYYFSISCSATTMNEDGTYSPINEKMETLFRSSSALMGAYTGETKNGFVIDESWRENDGLVNTCSALYPLGQPHTEFDAENVKAGTWNVMPIYYGDHMSLQGGLFVKNDVRVYHAERLDMINSLG